MLEQKYREKWKFHFEIESWIHIMFMFKQTGIIMVSKVFFLNSMHEDEFTYQPRMQVHF